MKIYILAIHDKISGNVFGFVNAFDIKSGIKFLTNLVNDNKENLPNLADYEIIKIGYLNPKDITLHNEYEVLLGLNSLLFENEKNEVNDNAI